MPHYGAAGASILLVNAVSGTTAGALTLGQTAIGGFGGGASIHGTPGAGGDAMSILSLTNTNAASLSGDMRAVAGRGGNYAAGPTLPSGPPGRGGTALSNVGQ